MPRDMYAEPIEIAIDVPYQVAYPHWEDVFQPIEAKTPAGQRFAEASTLHAVLGMALGDFEQVRTDAHYTIHLDQWHRPADGRCAVCLAGSVIAGTLGAPIEYDLDPDDFTTEITCRLAALDLLRRGDIGEAAIQLGIARSPEMEALSDKYAPLLEPFSSAMSRARAAGFLAIMRRMQLELGAAGL